MTKRFNLLPVAYAERVAERRRVMLTAGALMALVAVLGVDALAQGHHVSQAAKRRNVEQTRNAELQAQRRKLQPYRQLVDGIIGRKRLLTAGMQTHVSWATLLGNLSRTFPADASLTSFKATVTLPAFGTIPPSQPGVPPPVIGSTELKGYSVTRFTPGVDRLLVSLGSVGGLSEPRMQTGAVEKIGTSPVTTFEGNTFVDLTALTGRYAKGLPPEHDVDVPVTARAATPSATPGSAPRPSG